MPTAPYNYCAYLYVLYSVQLLQNGGGLGIFPSLPSATQFIGGGRLRGPEEGRPLRRLTVHHKHTSLTLLSGKHTPPPHRTNSFSSVGRNASRASRHRLEPNIRRVCRFGSGRCNKARICASWLFSFHICHNCVQHLRSWPVMTLINPTSGGSPRWQSSACKSLMPCSRPTTPYHICGTTSPAPIWNSIPPPHVAVSK